MAIDDAAREEAYRQALVRGLAAYPNRPVEVWVWTLDGRRVATGAPPPDPAAVVVAHARLD